MIIRLFLSAVAPGDIDEVTRRFREEVAPAFSRHPDCLGVELVMAAQPGVAGLVEGGALTRWTSVEAMDAALDSQELIDAQAGIRQLLRREPVRKVYTVV